MSERARYVAGDHSLGTKIVALSVGAVVFAAGFAAASEGHAQSAFDRDRNVGVLQRPHPGYDAEGIRVRSFIVRPELTLAAEHDDNIYAAETAKIGDSLLSLRPKLTVASDWSRHLISLNGGLQRDIYHRQSQENTTRWQVAGQGRVDVLRDFRILGNAEYARAFEDRGSASYTQVTESPIAYDSSTASLAAVKDFNRVRLTGRFNVEDLNYKDGVAADGSGGVDEDYRDRDAKTFTGRVDYALSPATALFLEAAGTKTDYDISSARNSDGTRVLVGANFELTNLVTGEVGVGRSTRDFDDATQAKEKNASYRAKVTWFPSPLLTVDFAADRAINDSSLLTSLSYTSDTARVEADYELRRNLVLVATLDHARDRYKDIDREDKRYGGGVSANLLLNRSVGFNFSYTVLKQDSSGSPDDRGVDFTEQRIGLAFVLQR